MKPLRIGPVTIENPVLLAPMAGVSDLPFRTLCREMGAGMACTEMVSAKAIYYSKGDYEKLAAEAAGGPKVNNHKTWDLLKTGDGDYPLAVQLFGSDPDILGEAARILSEGPFDVIDLNMGCPVAKVVNNNEGSALMKDPHLTERILTTLVKSTDKPVTVKIRKGFDEDHANAVEIAKIAEGCGIAAVTVHGRTRDQLYTGKADRDCIRRVKEAVSIPVIGNGDIFTPLDAKLMFDETGCDGIMVARGARGNPWIFRDITAYLDTGEIPPGPSPSEIAAMILRQAHMEADLKGERIALPQMRKHIDWYTVGLRGAASLRRRADTVSTMTELEDLVRELDKG